MTLLISNRFFFLFAWSSSYKLLYINDFLNNYFKITSWLYYYYYFKYKFWNNYYNNEIILIEIVEGEVHSPNHW